MTNHHHQQQQRRLVDYVAVVVYEQANNGDNDDDDDDEEDASQTNGHRQRQRAPQGRIVQRFSPTSRRHKRHHDNDNNDDENDEDEDDNDDSDDDDDEEDVGNNIQCFCQPHPPPRSSNSLPTFHVAVLTDVKGARRYLASLTFDDIDTTDSDDDDDDDDDEETPRRRRRRRRRVSKSLVLVSRFDYVEFFRASLGLIYSLAAKQQQRPPQLLLERCVANLLGVRVAAPGTALLTQFSLLAGAGGGGGVLHTSNTNVSSMSLMLLQHCDTDKHTVQSSASLTVPATETRVHALAARIGVGNLLRLVCAVIADFKVRQNFFFETLFFSKNSLFLRQVKT